MEAYFDCQTESCENYPERLQEKFLEDAKLIISEGLSRSKKVDHSRESHSCFECHAESFEIGDLRLNGR